MLFKSVCIYRSYKTDEDIEHTEEQAQKNINTEERFYSFSKLEEFPSVSICFE